VKVGGPRSKVGVDKKLLELHRNLNEYNMSIRSLEEFKAWQKSRKLCQDIYLLILSNPKITDLALKNQINRSSGSVMDNLAEGLGRKTNNEFIQFLTIALGSLYEVQSQLYRAVDRQYVRATNYEELVIQSEEISRMIVALIHKLKGAVAENQHNKRL